MKYVPTNPEKAYLGISAQKRMFSNSKRDYRMKNKRFGSKSLRFDGAVDPFSYQVLRATLMDS